MKIRNNSILILGQICLVLEVVRAFYYTDSTLDAASYFCMSTFIFLVSDVFARLKEQSEEEHRDINVPMTEPICLMPATAKTAMKDTEKDNGIYLVELMLLEKIERFTPEFLESKSIRFIEAQKYDLYYYLREYRALLDKDIVTKLEATINLISETHRIYKAPLNGDVYDTRILFKKDFSRDTPLIMLIETRNALKWALEFVKFSDKGRSTAENRLNKVEEQIQKNHPTYFNHMKLQDNFNK